MRSTQGGVLPEKDAEGFSGTASRVTNIGDKNLTGPDASAPRFQPVTVPRDVDTHGYDPVGTEPVSVNRRKYWHHRGQHLGRQDIVSHQDPGTFARSMYRDVLLASTMIREWWRSLWHTESPAFRPVRGVHSWRR